jgi:hypothetical protein
MRLRLGLKSLRQAGNITPTPTPTPAAGLSAPVLTRTSSSGTNRMDWSASYPSTTPWDGVDSGDKVDMRFRVNGGAWTNDTRQVLDAAALIAGTFAWPVFNGTTFAAGAFVEAQEMKLRFVGGVLTDTSAWSNIVSDTMGGAGLVNDKMLFFGDSITFAANSFANLFGFDHPKVNNNVNAIAGTSLNTNANSFMSRQAAGLALNCEALMVLAGANDLSDAATYPTVTDWMNALYAFTDPFRAAGTKVYVIPPLPQGTNYPNSATHNTRRATVRTTLLAAVGTKVDGVVDLNSTVMGPDSAANDVTLFDNSGGAGTGLHPTDLGHTKIYAVSRLSTRTALGLGTWTPAEWIYPGGAVDGAFQDISDISTLFKDTAGTTPVTTAADAIARVNDKSGNGYHFLQATAANRPLYQTNGGAGGANPIISFDGVNDNMQTASFASKAQPHWEILGCKFNSIAGNGEPTDGQSGNRASMICIAGGDFFIQGGSSADTLLNLTTNYCVIEAGYNGSASFGSLDGVDSANVLAGSNPLTGLTWGSSYVPNTWFGGPCSRKANTFGSTPNVRVRGFFRTWVAAGQGQVL